MRVFISAMIPVLLLSSIAGESPGAETTKITITIDRGQDLGQSFGSLFEATSDDGLLVLGASFQNAYNTRYRADRHAVFQGLSVSNICIARPIGARGSTSINRARF
jgi:hypothetical protein